jgi:hypothetical protein
VKETRIEKVREAGGRLARCGAGAILERKISDIRYQISDIRYQISVRDLWRYSFTDI